MSSLPTLYPDYTALFDNAWSQEPTESLPLGNVLERIRDGDWAEPIATLRGRLERGNQHGYDDSKRNLPAFTMSAACLTRQKDIPLEAKMVGHTGILQADFDSKDNPQLSDISEVRRILADDPHVTFLFTSPSGRGVKAGIRINPKRHRESFFAAETHYLKSYALQMDRSTKDPLRLCFVSHDPDLLINPTASVIPIPEDSLHDPAAERWLPPVETTESDVREMLSFIPPRPHYDDWIRIASAVWSVLPMLEGCRALAEWSPEEKQGEYAEKHRHRLSQIGIGTLIWYASQHGFDARSCARRKQWAGRIRFADPTTRDATEDFSTDPSKNIRQVQLQRELVSDCFSKAQRGDAALYAFLARGRKLYDHLGQVWRTYDGGIWERDDMQATFVESADTLATAYETLADSISQEIKSQSAPNAKDDPRRQQIRQIHARCSKLRSTGYLGGVLRFGESILATKATDFDRDEGILAVRNGVLDFRNGVFREHRASDLLTVRTPCSFEPEANCPRWERFLEYFLQGDRELIAYLARAVGYSLTGFVDQDVLFFSYGKGANGKSTFTAALKLLAGEMMTTIPIVALLARTSDNNFDYRKAQMEGKRIVVSDEIPESQQLNESAIKSLVGGDEITARRPYEKPYTFKPTHKLWLVGNHKPQIKGTDYGIWRRVHLIPWIRTIPEQERRPRHEILAEFREELSGILNWCIAGYIDMVDNGGLRPPKSVLDATREYKQDSDQFAQFLEARVERIFGFSTPLTELRHAYEAWCEDEGEEPRYRTNQKVANYLREHGWEIIAGHARQKSILGMCLNRSDESVG